MSEDRNPGFYLGETDDGRFVAASVVTPFFCFVAQTEDDVVAKANRAMRFFFSDEGQAFPSPVSSKSEVISFSAQRRIEVVLEAA